MTALLALIPARAYLIGGAVLALLLALGGYTVHERNVQHAKDIAAAAKLVTKDNAIVATDNAQAKTTETQSALIYKQVISISAIPDIGVVCQRAARSVPLPAANAVAATAVGNDAAVSGVGPTFDPTGATLTRGKNADAEIAYLQRRVAELKKQMNDAP